MESESEGDVKNRLLFHIFCEAKKHDRQYDNTTGHDTGRLGTNLQGRPN